MTTEELKEELKKQSERDMYNGMISEYLRVKALVSASGALTHDECCAIAMEVCKCRNIFDLSMCNYKW